MSSPLPRVLILAPPTSYRVPAYRQAARALGIELVLVTEGSHSLIAAREDGMRVDFGAPEDVVARVLAEARKRPFAGVVATDDSTVEVASRAAMALGLPHNPLAAARVSRRKDLARECLRRAGLPVPSFRTLDLSRDLRAQARGVRFPCVVKPLALAGSRGVIRANGHAELHAACQRIKVIISSIHNDEERRLVLVEDYLSGVEVAVEGMLRAGSLEVLAVFDKPAALEGPYFEETYYVAPSTLRAAVQGRIAKRVAEACAAYGLREGPIHAELRIGADEIWVLEIAARTIGGDCARLLQFGTGNTLEEYVLAHAIGLKLEAGRWAQAAGVLMIPIDAAGCLRRVEGVLAARKVEHVEDVVIAVRDGYELVPLPEGSSYLGFIFARGPSSAEVHAALREAHACLDVVVAPMWELHPRHPSISSPRAPETPSANSRGRLPETRSPACVAR